MRVLLMVAFSLIVPTVAFAGIAEVIGGAFGEGAPGRPVIWLLGLSIGRYILGEVASLTGGNMKGINMIIKCAEIGIVIAAVYALLNTAFNLLGL